jgi:hypothetical protein
MDTGFRRYDGSFVPSRRSDHSCTSIFEGGKKDSKSGKIFDLNRRVFVVRHSLAALAVFVFVF